MTQRIKQPVASKPFHHFIVVVIGGGRNAGLLAVQILGASDSRLREQMLKFKARLAAELRAKNVKMKAETSACRKA